MSVDWNEKPEWADVWLEPAYGVSTSERRYFGWFRKVAASEYSRPTDKVRWGIDRQDKYTVHYPPKP